MQQRTVDMLLSDLEEELNFADPERYRLRVNDHNRTVFRRIGYDLVAGHYSEQMSVAGHQLQLPSHVLKVDDLSLDGNIWEGYEVGDDMYPNHILAFTKSPFGLHLPNMAEGVVYVRFLGLEKDKDGQALIPDEAYEAVHEYNLGNLLKTLYQHPRFPERYTILQNAERLIAESRVALMGDSSAQRRTQRRVLGGVGQRTDGGRFWNSN